VDVCESYADGQQPVPEPVAITAPGLAPRAPWEECIARLEGGAYASDRRVAKKLEATMARVS
jgi:hypothetical protein